MPTFPLIKVDQAASFIKAIKGMAKPVKAVKAKKAKPKKKKKAIVKKPIIKKEPKPKRKSPLAIGDIVWYHAGGLSFSRGTIASCLPPSGSSQQWRYSIETGTGKTNGSIPENYILPESCLTMLANDASKITYSQIQQTLNMQFDEPDVRILEVYRKGRPSRPWAYYVLPDFKMIWKTYTWKGDYGYDQSETLLVAPWPRLRPVSSVPQEILTYLGLHIYNRKWKHHGSNQEPE